MNSARRERKAKAEEASLPAGQIPLFLEQQTYRRRRLMDAARLLPALGLALVLLPVLWVPGNMSGGTARGIIYIFAVWIGLIVAAAVLSRRLTPAPEEAEGDDDV